MNYTTSHSITVKARCPVDPNVVDEYEVTIFVPEGTHVWAEAITKAVDLFTESAISQEHLTQALANFLRCRVISKGTHVGGRVRTTVDRHPAGPAVVKPEDIS